MTTGTVARRVKLGGLLALPATAAVLAFASIAFACTPQATLTLSPTSGPGGTPITVTGKSFTEGSNVTVFWGGISGQAVGSAVAPKSGTITVSFNVPPGAPNGATIVSANQVNAAGVALGSPANAVFTVNTPGGAAVTPAANLQQQQPAGDPAAALAPLDAAAPAKAPVVRVAPKAPARTTAAAPAKAPAAAVAPTPATVTPAPAPQPAPAPAQVEATQPQPQPAPAPAAAPARRTATPASSDHGGSSALPFVLVGLVVLAALGTTAAVVASRRDRKAPAKARH